MIGPMFPFQIAAGIILGFAFLALTRAGISIHRSNGGWRSALGATMFVVGFLSCGMIVIAASLSQVP